MKLCLLDLSKSEFKSRLNDLSIKSFVADQIWDWVMKKYCVSWSEMKNISKQNQAILDEHFTILPFKSHTILKSEDDSAKKFVIHLHDGQAVEMVVLTQEGYYTLCVSSQSGCPVDCKFCLTGIVGFKRQLDPSEIVGQVLLANSSGYPISNLVFMGMGEPLLNYDAVFKGLDVLCSEEGFGISKRKVTISTSGYLASIKRLIDDERFINLAFSVGHPNPVIRQQIMPIEKRNPFYEVCQLIKKYQKMHNRKLTLEYTLLKGKNDDQFTIRELANVAKYLDAKVNVINLNPHPKIPFEPVSAEKVRQVKEWLKAEKVPVTVRFRKGQDISAACGQLGESHLEGVQK